MITNDMNAQQALVTVTTELQASCDRPFSEKTGFDIPPAAATFDIQVIVLGRDSGISNSYGSRMSYVKKRHLHRYGIHLFCKYIFYTVKNL